MFALIIEYSSNFKTIQIVRFLVKISHVEHLKVASFFGLTQSHHDIIFQAPSAFVD